MRAVGYRFRAEVRRRWAATLVLVVLVGVAGGAVIAALSGARRTASSYTRLLRATVTSDALVNPDDDGFPMEEAAKLPQVESWSRLTGTGIVPIRNGQPDFSVAATTATSDGRSGYSTDQPYDLQGRMPEGPDEVFLSRGLARREGLGVGDRAPFEHFLSQSSEGDQSETLDLTVTGIGATVYETLQPPGQGFDVILLPPAFARAHPSAPVFVGLEVRLRGGDREAAAFAREIAGLAGGHAVFVQRQSATTAKAQQTLRPYVGALAAFAIALALTALLVLGQALSRHLATLATDDATLVSAGMSHRQLALLTALRAGAVGAGGALVAVAVAVGASPLMPIGPAHSFEPSPGLSFDGLVVPAGVVAVTAVSVAFGLAASLRRRRATATARPGRADRLAALLQPAPATGLRMALDPGRRDRAVPARATVAGAALGLAAITASLTFGASLHRFLSTPRLYGWAWDAQVDLSTNQGNELSAVESAAGVADATPGVNSILSVEGASVPAIGLGKGAPALHPPLLAGRAPRAPDEIALGSDTLRTIGRSVGDRVRVGVDEHAATMRIVGRATFSRFAAYPGADKTGLGVGAQLTLEGLARVVPNDEQGLDFVLVHLAGGREGAARLQRTLTATFADVGPEAPQVRFDPQRPDDLLGYDRVDRTPLLLAGLLVLLSAGATSHGLVAAVRRRRRELAVLRAMGFTGGEVRAAVRWQSGIIAVLAGVVGLPVGIVLGRLAWTALADRLGTPAGPVVPVAALAALVLGTLLVALAVAEVPARHAARVRPALVLRAE